MSDLEKKELIFYRNLEVETGGLQKRKVKAQALWLELQNQLAKYNPKK